MEKAVTAVGIALGFTAAIALQVAVFGGLVWLAAWIVKSVFGIGQ